MTSPRTKRKRNQNGNDEEYSIADVMAKLISIEKNQNTQIDEIKSTLVEIKDQQTTLQNNYKSLAKTSDEQQQNHKVLKDIVHENSSDIDHIYNNLDRVNYKLNNLLQEKINLNLIINGIPKIEQEDIKEVVTKLFTYMGMTAGSDIIESTWRIHNKNDSPPIIVRLKNRSDKNKILKLRKINNGESEGKSLFAKDFGYNSDKQIFINEELTQPTRKLLNDAKKQLKNKNFKFIWITDGKVLAKKNESAKTHFIRNNYDVTQLMKTYDEDVTQLDHNQPSGSGINK